MNIAVMLNTLQEEQSNRMKEIEAENKRLEVCMMCWP